MEQFFVLGQQLGSGVDGIVRLCSHKLSGRQFACKSIPKESPDALRHIRTEIALLQKLKGHPHVLNFETHFEDEDSVHLVVELCEGGDLYENLKERERLSEAEAAQAFKAVLRAVSFCHEQRVMHRDLKLENILFPTRHSDYSQLKLADFGASADFSRRRVFSEVEGTPWYVAPEVLTGYYDEKVDVWSLGVLLHILLCGYAPFDGATPSEIFEAVKKGRLDLRRDPWPSISAEAKELIKGMLQKNPYRRMKLVDLLNHAWVQGSQKTSDLDDLQSWTNLQISDSVAVGG